MKPEQEGKREDPRGVAGVQVLQSKETEPTMSEIRERGQITIVKREQKEKERKAWECCHIGDTVVFVLTRGRDCTFKTTKPFPQNV